MFGTVQISCDTTRSFIVEQDSSLFYHTPSSITGRTELKESELLEIKLFSLEAQLKGL